MASMISAIDNQPGSYFKNDNMRPTLRIFNDLEKLSHHAATSEALEAGRARAFTEAQTVARALSGERRQAAVHLGAAISRELESLGMGGARIHVELTPVGGDAGEVAVDGARLSADGLERAEFLIAPNRGEEARSLHKVASGGELSSRVRGSRGGRVGRAARVARADRFGAGAAAMPVREVLIFGPEKPWAPEADG